jgi:segregation and condensation protein B
VSELELKRIVEALLFSSDTPVGMDRFSAVLESHERSDIRDAIDQLAREYDEEGRSFTITKLAGGWQLYARPDYSKWIRDLNRSRASTRLSQAALETLAIVAYRQPIVRAEVEAVRGVDSSGVLATLLKRDLIAIAGRAPGMGRALMYRTTKEFLRYFGLDTVTDLPRLEEFAEVLGLKPEELEATLEGAESAGAGMGEDEFTSASDGDEDADAEADDGDAEGARSEADPSYDAPPDRGESPASAGIQTIEEPAPDEARTPSDSPGSAKSPSTVTLVAPTATDDDGGEGARPPFTMHSVPDGEIMTPLDED